MEATKPVLSMLRRKLKEASLRWLEGFREACCLHRVVLLCFRSKKLLIRMGQCFLLNGFIFLGSMFALFSVVIPTLLWILPNKCSEVRSEEPYSFGSTLKLYSFLRAGLVQIFYLCMQSIPYHAYHLIL